MIGIDVRRRGKLKRTIGVDLCSNLDNLGVDQRDRCWRSALTRRLGPLRTQTGMAKIALQLVPLIREFRHLFRFSGPASVAFVSGHGATKQVAEQRRAKHQTDRLALGGFTMLPVEL